MAHTRTISVDIVEREYRTEIEFTYHKGYRGSFYEPPESPHVEIERVTLLGKDDKPLETPSWLADAIAESDYVRDELIEYALEDF